MKRIKAPVTRIFNSEEFAPAFRSSNLCIPFQSLVLKGPQGSFEASGMLVSRDQHLTLECSPIPHDGTTVPACKSLRVNAHEFWKATGVTSHGLELQLLGLTPPGSNRLDHNVYVSFNINVERFTIARTDHVTDEILAKLEGADQVEIIRAQQRECPSISMEARIAETELKFTNTVSRIDRTNSFFKHQGWQVKLDSLVGDLPGWRFCFRQEESDIVLYVCSTDACKSLDATEDRKILDGLLVAFSFMHGCNAYPWRGEHQRNDWNLDDEYRVEFEHSEGCPRPVEGPSSMTRDLQSLPTRMIVILANYFASEAPLADMMKKHIWQVRQAASGNQLKLSSCLHLCAILEGMTKDILIHRCGWSKTKLRNTSAVDRFKEVCSFVGLLWIDQFESVFKVWKDMRDDLAHGDFFGADGAWGKDMFNLKYTICGGIYALLLAEAGWKEPMDLNNLQKTKFLYFC